MRAWLFAAIWALSSLAVAGDAAGNGGGSRLYEHVSEVWLSSKQLLEEAVASRDVFTSTEIDLMKQMLAAHQSSRPIIADRRENSASPCDQYELTAIRSGEILVFEGSIFAPGNDLQATDTMKL